MSRRFRPVPVLFALLLLLPSAAYAQASITGVVRDTSGAVLPGVTVEAWHSDALHTIEHLRREGNTLHYRITIDDSKIFTRPFSQDFELTLRPDWEQIGLLEYVCEENNRCAGGNCRKSDVQ